MTDKLNILVLHRMGDPLLWRTAVKDLEFMLPTYAAEYNYIVHAAELPLPDFVKDITFHGIVLGPTFLCSRYNSKILEKTLEEYDFIRTSDAFKIAMPQDDYDCSAILDRWMVDWKIDLVYTVCPEHWSVLYPSYSEIGKIELGYTGYISDSWIESWKNTKAFNQRSIDISYRANKLLPNFGTIGNIKGEIGEIFEKSVSGEGFKLDISTNPKKMLPGDKWHSFIENSKFCLATNSGSSLLDPEGSIRKKVNLYLTHHPKALFQEVEQNCFPGEDCRFKFLAISPRNIEAALAKTVQIATPGPYNGILKAYKHYIPLEPDCSNIKEVLSIMKDNKKVNEIAENCKETILSVDDLRFKNHVVDIIEKIKSDISNKKINGTSQEEMQRFISMHNNIIMKKTVMFWKKKRIVQSSKKIAKQLGVKRIISLFGKG